MFVLGQLTLSIKLTALKRLISLICNNPGFAQLACKFSVKNLLKTHHDKRGVKHFNSDCDLYVAVPGIKLSLYMKESSHTTLARVATRSTGRYWEYLHKLEQVGWRVSV